IVVFEGEFYFVESQHGVYFQKLPGSVSSGEYVVPREGIKALFYLHVRLRAICRVSARERGRHRKEAAEKKKSGGQYMAAGFSC
ncbi:MAG: hypothetical protein RSD99_09880, partial [Janthinobacterium sp.]